MVLHPMTWFHLAVGLSEATYAPLPVVSGLLLIQRLLGDTLTHPLVYVSGVVAFMMVYRSMGIATGMDVFVWPKNFKASSVRLFAYIAPCLIEIVWIDIVGLALIMVGARIADVIWITTQPNRRLAMYKIGMYVPLYIIWVAGAVSTQPLAYRVTRLLVVCLCVVYISFIYTMQWYRGRVAWLVPVHNPNDVGNAPSNKNKTIKKT